MSVVVAYHVLIVLALVAAPWFAPTIGFAYFRRIERVFADFARRQGLMVVLLITTVIAARVALLLLMPVPEPNIHDEFSYLLAGDTFAHARLANPPHPMWVFFETFHVLQQPTYASIYPPAQGSILALGQVLGRPWYGVLISAALMCGAILWALQGWMPPGWALLGGVLVALRFGMVGEWVNTYWGGAAAATGGALVIGAFPRIVRKAHLRHVLLLGLGTVLLANSRPLEGGIFCLPVFVALGAWLYSLRSTRFTAAMYRVLLPLLFIFVGLIGFAGYDNWRVTQNPLVFPEALDSRIYTNYPMLLWQKPHAPLHYLNAQFETFYNVVTPSATPRGFLWSFFAKSHKIWLFFIGTTLSISLLCIPNLLRDRKLRLPLFQCLISFLCALPIVWFFPHYFAPLTATIFILLTQLMRHLRQWSPGGRPAGVFLTRLIVVCCLARPAAVIAYATEHPIHDWRFSRAEILSSLNKLPERNLILVGYHPDHVVEHEWVYNSADIDNSKVVWARIIPGRDISPLLEYFKDRKIWILDADAHPVTLRPYSGVELHRVLDSAAVTGADSNQQGSGGVAKTSK